MGIELSGTGGGGVRDSFGNMGIEVSGVGGGGGGGRGGGRKGGGEGRKRREEEKSNNPTLQGGERY